MATVTAVPPKPAPPLGRAAWAVGFAAFVLAAGVAGRNVPDRVGGEVDFAEYAAAAELLLAGQNPYDPAKLLELQRPTGWTGDKAQMMWNPPWAFPVVLLAAVRPLGSAFLAWDAVQLLAVVLGTVWAYRRPVVAVPIALALVFAPTIYLLRLGQVSGLLVLGVGGFIAAMRAGRPGLAGAAAALTALKPHLLLPFGVLLVCDAMVSRDSRRALIVGAGVLGLAAVFPLAWNPDVWSQYVAAVRAPSDALHWAPSDWLPPTLAAHLRDAAGGGLLAQFAPSALATLALVGYWWSRRHVWDWGKELPVVVLVSVLTTGYGAWGFDLVVLLVPIAHAAALIAGTGNARLALWSAMAYLAFCGAMLVGLVYVLWWAPIVALGYAAVVALTRAGSRVSAP